MGLRMAHHEVSLVHNYRGHSFIGHCLISHVTLGDYESPWFLIMEEVILLRQGIAQFHTSLMVYKLNLIEILQDTRSTPCLWLVGVFPCQDRGGSFQEIQLVNQRAQICKLFTQLTCRIKIA
jgi:hypothetical protein